MLKVIAMRTDEFKGYTSEQKQKIEHWKTAIGLQAVDGLQPSGYLYELAGKHIEGKIDIKEVQSLLNTYYEDKENRVQDNSTGEADKVSANIMEILHDNQFCLCADELKDIHNSLFHNVLPHAGLYRLNNFIKKEWVLQMDTVEYADFRSIETLLEKAIKKEQLYNYKSMTDEDCIKHLADFIAEIWQIHPFFEGNTRTTAIFAVKYLRSIGKDIDNEIFRNHSLYFRNALARANYSNIDKNIDKNPTYLYNFFMNLLAGQENRLRNRDILVSPPEGWSEKEQNGLIVEGETKSKRSRLTGINVYVNIN